MEEMNKKKENEEYDECKFIKDKIDKIRKISLKIYTLEEEKKEAANKNDFDKAKEMKLHIEKIKKRRRRRRRQRKKKGKLNFPGK